MPPPITLPVRALLSLGLVTVLFAGSYALHGRLDAHGAPKRSAFATALDRVAREISGRADVHVRCGPTVAPGILGTVTFYGDAPGDEALLAPQVCTTLRRLWRTRRPPSLACTALGGGECGRRVIELAWATSALAHESYHLKGVRDEAAAECYGLQSTALVAERLGATPDEAARLGDYTFWNVRPPVDGDYFSTECRDGGALDLRPASSRWP